MLNRNRYFHGFALRLLVIFGWVLAGACSKATDDQATGTEASSAESASSQEFKDSRPGPEWLGTLSEAKAQAAQAKKPVLAMISASWCGPCNAVKKDILPQAAVKTALSGYVLLYIDGDNNQIDTQTLGGNAFPTFVVLKADGVEAGRFIGARRTAGEFLDALKQITPEGGSARRSSGPKR